VISSATGAVVDFSLQFLLCLVSELIWVGFSRSSRRHFFLDVISLFSVPEFICCISSILIYLHVIICFCDGVLGFSLGVDEKSLTHLIAEIVYLQYVQRCSVLNALKRSSRFSFQGVVHARKQLCRSGER
jgi:hypothetical protein